MGEELEHVALNRANWDDRTVIHLASDFYDVEGWLEARPGPRARETAALGSLEGLDVIHLQCHFGLDTLSLANAGAHVTGLDLSPRAVAAATDLAERAGLSANARFVCADVHDAADAVAPATFDVVYVSLGALCWLPSVRRWAGQVAALLRPGGRLYLHETHPLSFALADDDLGFHTTYFEEPEPYVDDHGFTYTGDDDRLAHAVTHQWNHSIGETVSAVIDAGLVLDSLVEHDWTVFRRWPWLVEQDAGGRPDDRIYVLPDGHPRLPLTFTLLASRPR